MTFVETRKCTQKKVLAKNLFLPTESPKKLVFGAKLFLGAFLLRPYVHF
jgi:hypothetical protein